MELLYFAWVRERVGVAGETVEPPREVVDVRGLIAWLAGRSDGHRAAFEDPARLRAGMDGRFISLDEPIAGAREIALFPPVTGG